MAAQILRRLARLPLEEKILNAGSFVACICIFFPWIGGEWLGGKVITYSGLGFFTSFIGVAVLLLHTFIILVTFIPLTGGPRLIKAQNKHIVRLVVAIFATILTIAVWSVLTKFTFEFSRLQIHFGLYGTLIGSFVATLYSFLQFQDGRRTAVEDLFHGHSQNRPPEVAPPSPEPEDHRIYHTDSSDI